MTSISKRGQLLSTSEKSRWKGWIRESKFLSSRAKDEDRKRPEISRRKHDQAAATGLRSLRRWVIWRTKTSAQNSRNERLWNLIRGSWLRLVRSARANLMMDDWYLVCQLQRLIGLCATQTDEHRKFECAHVYTLKRVRLYECASRIVIGISNKVVSLDGALRILANCFITAKSHWTKSTRLRVVRGCLYPGRAVSLAKWSSQLCH